MNPLRSGIHTRGYLPHVKREGVRYFVTFRLADALPQQVVTKLQAERAERLARFYAEEDAAEKLGTAPPEPSVLELIERDYYRGLERHLDDGLGECWLRRPEIAGLAANAL